MGYKPLGGKVKVMENMFSEITKTLHCLGSNRRIEWFYLDDHD